MNSLSRIVIVPLLIVAAISVWGFGPISAERICYAQGPAVVAPTINGPLTAGDTKVRGTAFPPPQFQDRASILIQVRTDRDLLQAAVCDVRANSFECTLDGGKLLREGWQVRAQLVLKNPNNSVAATADSATLTVQAFPAVAPTIKGPLTAGDTKVSGAFARNYDPFVATFFFLDRNNQWVCGVQGPVRAGDVTCILDQGKFLREGQQVKAQLFLRYPDNSFLTKVDSATLTVQAFRAVPPTIKGPLTAGETTLRGSFAGNYDPFVATFFFLDQNNQWVCGVQGSVRAGDVTCNLDQGKFLLEGQQVKAQLWLRYPDGSFLTKVDSATLTVQADPRAKKKLRN